MRLTQLIYASRPFGFDDNVLATILQTARSHNERVGITGALICRNDIYLQMLEGPRDAVTGLFSRILRDDRHADITLLCCADAADRLFPEWAMRDDPVRSWMWSREEIHAGAVRDISMASAWNVFARLSREVH